MKVVEKQLKTVMVISIVGVVALVIGVSYAIFSGVISSNNRQVIKSGSIALNLSADTSLDLEGISEMTDEEGIEQTDYYEFNITNTGSDKTFYTIKLIDDEEANTTYGGTVLLPNYIMVSVEEDGVKKSAVNLAEVERIIETNTIDVNVTKNYKLRFWLKFGTLTEEEKEVFLDQEANFKLKIESEQLGEKTKPVCKITNANKDTYVYEITCTDDSAFSDSVLLTSDFTLTNPDASISNITQEAVTNGFKYTITFNAATDFTLKANSVKDKYLNGNETLVYNYFNLANTWKDKTENELNYLALYTLDSKTLPSTYSYDGTTYNLETSIDVSEQGGGFVMLGEYKSGDNMIAVIGQDGGVIAPSDSSFLFKNIDYDSSSYSILYGEIETLDLSNLDTSNVTLMRGMFYCCQSLITLDISNFDTSNVTDMSYMFYNFYYLKTLDISNFDTSKVTSMRYMFYNCQNLTSLDLSSFDTSNVTDMSYMFYSCWYLTSLDLSSFDTSNVTDMNHMFYKCSSLTSLDLSSFDTSQVTDMSYMFYWLGRGFSLDLSTFDTSNVTNMTSMFELCLVMGLTVGCNWVIGTSTTTTDMFTDSGARSVTKVCNE